MTSYLWGWVGLCVCVFLFGYSGTQPGTLVVVVLLLLLMLLLLLLLFIVLMLLGYGTAYYYIKHTVLLPVLLSSVCC